MTMRLVAIPDVFLPDGTVQRGELHALLDQFMRNRPSVLRVNIGLARQLRAGIITINEVRQQMGLLMTVSLAAVPDVFLPDGTIIPGPLYGSQEPRFWTAPARHRVIDPECGACKRGTRSGSTSGCGNLAAEELLEWCPEFGYYLDTWQEWWLTEACGTKPDGRWTAFEAASICNRQNGKNQKLEVRELGGLYLFGESMIIHTAHEFKAAAEHFRRVRDTISSYDELSKRVKRVMTSHGDEAIELRPKPTLIFGLTILSASSAAASFD